MLSARLIIRNKWIHLHIKNNKENMKSKLLCALLLPAICLTANAQTIFKTGVRDGLSSNYVHDITQDRNGYMWFATTDGLSCFDGTKYTAFYHKRGAGTNSISGDALNAVMADREEPIVWVGTQRDGLNAYHYEEGRFIVYRHEKDNRNSLATNDITDIVPGGRGKIWISTYWQGAELLDKKSGRFYHFNTQNVHGMPSNRVWCMTYDQKGKLYLGGVDSGLTIVDVERRTARNFQHRKAAASLPCNEIFTLCLDTYGQLWIGTHDGVAIYDTNRGCFIDMSACAAVPETLKREKILCIKQIGGYVWISAEFDGVYRLQQVKFDGRLRCPLPATHYTQGFRSDRLSDASAYCVYGDRYGNVWLGTWGGGINFISHIPETFRNIEYDNGASSDQCVTERNVLSVCTDGRGLIYACPKGGGINVFSGGRRIAVLTKENGQTTDNVVMSSLRDSKGGLWFGTYSGWIYRTDALSRTMRRRQLLVGKGSLSEIHYFYEDSRGSIWVGTNCGIYVLNALTMAVEAHYDDRNSPLPEPFIRSICQDWHGRYWVGTFGGGLVLLSPDMKLIRRFYVSNNFCSNTINHIIQGLNDKIWVATGDGVVCFDASNPTRYRCYNEADGLLSSKAQSLAQDAQGNIWAGTNKGLSCIVPPEGRAYTYANIDHVGYGEFNGAAVATDTGGDIFFGYNGGVCHFNPSVIKRHYHLPPIGFTNLELRQGMVGKANKTICLARRGTIMLKYDENTFSVGFNVRDNALCRSVSYTYRVKELSDTWYEIGHDQAVTFRDLPHGTYTLEVKARLGDTIQGGSEASVVIDIAPPFWLSWWAKTLYALLSLAAIGLACYAYRRYLLRMNQLQMEQAGRRKETELNDERLRFYTNIAHELRTPLTLVIGPLDDLLRHGTLSELVRHKIETVDKNANRLLDLVNQILEFRRTETRNRKLKVARQKLAEVVNEEWLRFKEANQNPNLVLGLDVADPSLTLYFDKEVVATLLDNLLSNAVKYTPSGSIMVTVGTHTEADGPWADISVVDTGCGIPDKALPHLFDRYYRAPASQQTPGTGIGLALAKNLAELHEGTLNVKSHEGQGSTFTLSLSVENTYPNAEHTDGPLAAEAPQPSACSPGDQADGNAEDPAFGSRQPQEGDDDTPSLTPPCEGRESEAERLLILVVEDNPDIAAYIKDSFEDIFDIATAANGKEGEQLAYQLTPDMVVSDIMMPVMNGFELCHRLKNDIRTSHIPIILLTAKDSLTDKEEGYQAGADSYITKPFSSSLLLSRINNLIESRKRLASQTNLAQLTNKKQQLSLFANQHDNDFIRRVSDIISQNIADEKLDISFVAEHTNMSISSLYRKMKALTGLSTNEFIRKMRMTAAEEMLLRQDLSISDIAYRLGFSSLSYFRQCFKDEYGTSPTEYIKKMK
jgi:signal transduction histidine kinase/ligand-binding sensor domain-containing protein/AraC-like DNA-binding protein